MKKLTVFVLILLMVVCCSSCGKKEETAEESNVVEEIDPFMVEDDVVDSNEDYVIDFYDVLDNINNAKEFPNTSVDSSEYTHPFYDTLDLVSADEAKEMMKPHYGSYRDKEKDIEDIDLYFRLLKAYYGAYEYFGGDEAFDAAYEQIVKEINEYEGTMNKEDYRDIVIRNLDFVIDGHAQFADKEFLEYNHMSYQDYYLKDYYFYEDDNGIYTKINDRKWYLKSVLNNEDITSYLKLSIDDDGRLAYIVLLSACDNDERLTDSSITLQRGDREAELSFIWERFSQRKDDPNKYFHNLENKNSIAVVTVRDNMDTNDRAIEVPERLRTIGAETKDVEVIIYDILTMYDYDELIKPKGYQMFWEMQNFKASRVADYIGRTRIMPSDLTYGQYYKRTLKAVPVKDKTIKFFIQDRANGSGGENMISAFDTLYNTVFVGGRSKGLQICGGCYTFNLPNTGTYVQFGMNLMFNRNTIKNFDGIGYEPDIWVDTKEAQDKILKLCEYYNLNNSVTFDEILSTSETPEEPHSSEIQLDLGNGRVNVGEGFGFGMPYDKVIHVLNNGERFKDFECYVTNEDIASAEKNCGVRNRIKRI